MKPQVEDMNGNRPIKIILDPPNNETRLHLGAVAVNGYVKNPDRRWWQFWKPRYVIKQVEIRRIND